MKKNNTVKLAGKEVVALDLGQHTIKLVSGKPGKGSLNVQHAMSFPTPKNSIDNGRILDEESLRRVITEAMDSMKIRARMALCSMESSEIITREFLVPKASEEQVQKMLDYEIQQYMPIDLNDYLIQSKWLEEVMEEGTDKIRVLVTAVPRDLARSYYDLIHQLHLQPAVFDIQSNAVDKLIRSGHLVNGDTQMQDLSVALLDIGYRHINVIILENGRYKFNRFVNQGAYHIDHNLANFMDLDFQEAEKEKRNIADLYKELEMVDSVVDPNEQLSRRLRVLNIVQNTVDGWVEDIDRIFKYYTTRNAGNSIDAVYLYGGTSQLPGLDRYIEDSFNVKTSSVSSVTNVTVNQYTGEQSLGTYINALGTMIRR